MKDTSESNSLEVDTFVIKLERERKLAAQLDSHLVHAKAQAEEKREALRCLQKSRLRQEVALLEDTLQRANVALSELQAENRSLRRQADVQRRDLRERGVKAHSQRQTWCELNTSAELARGRSVRSLQSVQALHLRMSSLRSLHELRSKSSHMHSLAEQIRADKRRNREVLMNLEQGLREPKQEYTESAACLRALVQKWDEKVRGLRKELQQYADFIKALSDGFAALNPTGSDDDFGKVASATVAALHRNKNLAMQLLARTEECDTLDKTLAAARGVLQKRELSDSEAEAEANRALLRLRTALGVLEKERSAAELRQHMVRDAVADLAAILGEYGATLAQGEFRSTAVGAVTVESVCEVLKGLETGTLELSTLLLRLRGRRQAPWPDAKCRSLNPAALLSAWEPEECPLPRTREQFRAYVSKSVALNSWLYAVFVCNMESKSEELLYVGFNQDASCFSLGTDTGLKIFTSYPLRFCFERGDCHADFSGGIAIVEMLFRCNIIALVGGGKTPRYPPNKVMLWDDHLSRCVGELCFRTEVKAVRLRRDRIAVALEHKIYVYNFDDLHLLDTVETCHNPRGLCCMSSQPTAPVLACPDRLKGHVRLQLYCYERTVLISAHESSIACLTLNKDGTLLATASDKGTLVRIFNAGEGQLLQEVRRGVDRADIYCLTFDSLSKWLACSSDKGTVHIFAMKSDAGETKNPTSALSFMKKFLPKYFESEWSFSQFRVPDVRTVCAFGPTPGTLVVVSQDGVYYLATFDPETNGDCTQQIMRHLKDEEMRTL